MKTRVIPKMSVIVTIYNLEKQLDRCLKSLVNQTMKEIEIICVNDGSTDSSQKTIDEYFKQYPRIIKPFQKENGGGDWGARTFGLSKVKSEFFCFVDGDDYVYPKYAERLYKSISENDADMAVCAMERVDVLTGKVVSIDMNSFKNKIINVSGESGELCFINPGPCNKVYRYSKISDKEFHAIRGVSDLIFMLYAIPDLSKIVVFPEILYSYQVRTDSQIHNIKPHDIEVFKQEFLNLKKHYNFTKEREKFIDILDLMAFIHLGVSLMYRLSYGNKNIKKDTKDMILFLDDNFSSWRSSSFLKFSYCFSRGVKFWGLYGISKLYKMNLYIFFINTYKIFIHKLHVDIKY